MAKKPETFEKILTVKCRGWITSRELYEPFGDMACQIFEYGSLRKEKKNFIFEDLAFFKSKGWSIRYFGKKSNKLQILDAEFLGEEEPKEKGK